MDDYENNGRDYSENIDEGSIEPDDGLIGQETEGIFSRFSAPSKGCPPKKPDNTCPDKKSTEQKKSKSKSKSKKSCDCKPDKSKGRGSRGSRKKKLANSINPFIIFYLQMYFSSPNKRVTEVAREAGKKWCSMSEKEKADYIKKARAESAKRQRKRSKKGRGKC